jgi:Mg2+-importing ATPase
VAVLLAILLPFTSLGTYFGFVPLPPSYFGVLALLVVTYLVVVQVIKQQFYAHRQ